ncbi:transglutaminase family protein [Flavobacterium sp. UMI-01]|uniref:transglutaminase family protein n=1 Tax=Flavobacterium sp. UMI-01 TaxID=1441053 RepID=UPI001C7D9ECB|nr:transglutaminase family protein [Flavobacterium sp. UMI-01]GIZ07293.1 transglutaminase [Flavobacterium sp. UMI-01]
MAVFKIVHITKYQYNWPIKESINEIRLFPHHFENQDVLQYQLLITQNPEVIFSEDYHGNRVGNFNILEAHTEMSIESRMLVRVNHSLKIPEVDHATVSDLKNEKEKSIALLRFSYPEIISKQDEIDQILAAIGGQNKTIIALAQACSEYIYTHFTYTKGITTIHTTLDEILEIKKGVCQDFAHVLLQLMRTLGIPARYVSGYICPNQSGMRGEGATHAWVEVYSPVQGWLGIDPTNNIWTMDNHVKLSVGLNFSDCTPVKGTFKGLAKQTLSVCVSIGYEDGSHFEEINDVQLQEVSTEVQEQLDYIDNLYQQQVQQQQ